MRQNGSYKKKLKGHGQIHKTKPELSGKWRKWAAHRTNAKTNVERRPVFRLFLPKGTKRVKNNSKKISKGQDRQKKRQTSGFCSRAQNRDQFLVLFFLAMIPTRCNQLSAHGSGIVAIFIARMRQKTSALWILACHVVQPACKLVKCQHMLQRF